MNKLQQKRGERGGAYGDKKRAPPMEEKILIGYLHPL